MPAGAAVSTAAAATCGKITLDRCFPPVAATANVAEPVTPAKKRKQATNCSDSKQQQDGDAYSAEVTQAVACMLNAGCSIAAAAPIANAGAASAPQVEATFLQEQEAESPQASCQDTTATAAAATQQP